MKVSAAIEPIALDPERSAHHDHPKSFAEFIGARAACGPSLDRLACNRPQQFAARRYAIGSNLPAVFSIDKAPPYDLLVWQADLVKTSHMFLWDDIVKTIEGRAELVGVETRRSPRGPLTLQGVLIMFSLSSESSGV
jgi:hypothetical protein